MAKNVLAFGEILWDILPAGTILGGAPFNFACRVDSLGDRSRFVSRLGTDDAGKKAHETVKKMGLDTSLIQWDPDHPTGTVLVSFDEHGKPDYVIVPSVAYDFIEVTDKLLDTAMNADLFCFGTLVQRSEKTRDTLYSLLEKASGAVKLLDINLRKDCYSEETVRTSLEASDILKLNDDEAFELDEMLDIGSAGLPDFCKKMVDKWPIGICLVTLGERGVFAYSVEDGPVYVPGCRVDVGDTIGSGDAFTAGFVHSFLQGLPLAGACEFGNELGAVVATQKGATRPIEPGALEDMGKKERIVDPDLKNFRDRKL
jgi:fructokinase